MLQGVDDTNHLVLYARTRGAAVEKKRVRVVDLEVEFRHLFHIVLYGCRRDIGPAVEACLCGVDHLIRNTGVLELGPDD